MMLHEQERQLCTEQNTLQTTLTPIHLSDSAGRRRDVMDALLSGEEAEVQRRKVMCPSSHSNSASEL